MPESRSHFSRRVNRALDDPNLQKALIQAMTGLRARRNAAFENFDFAKGRAELKALLADLGALTPATTAA